MSFSYTPQVPTVPDWDGASVQSGRMRPGRPTEKILGTSAGGTQVHRFSRTLMGFIAIALVSGVSGLAQDSQPAQSGQAAPAAPQEKKKNYKDQQEYTLYDSATKESDANKKLQTLNTWKEKYPESDFKVERLKLYLDTYQKLGQAAKMVDTAKEILTVNPTDVTALYWITFLAPSSGGNSADALATATKA